jgi:hypothetical protein
MNRLLKSWTTEVRFEWYPLYRQIVLADKIDYQKIIIIHSQNGTIIREVVGNRNEKDEHGLLRDTTTETHVGITGTRFEIPSKKIGIGKRNLESGSPTPRSDYPLL